MEKKTQDEGIKRRTFLHSAATVGAGLAFARSSAGQTYKTKLDDLNIALIGAGAHGRVLMNSTLRIPGIRFKAVCDIWSYSQRYASRYLKKHGQEVNIYEDYREMLASEPDLDAVIVATPDWMHAEHANACMKAGLDVYCENAMSNSLAKAKSMVLTSRKTGRLLQIGHQRRSNPYYIYSINNIVHNDRLLGRVGHANAQWNRAKSDDLGWPSLYEMDVAALEKYGYENMNQFRNWRWYRKYGGGPIVDLASHQIDIFAWVFKSNPASILAGGGVDFYKHHECYDNAMCIFEYDTPEGKARASCQVLTTTSHGGHSETFMGNEGTLILSESPKKTKLIGERKAKENWYKWAAREDSILLNAEEYRQEHIEVGADSRCGCSSIPQIWSIPIAVNTPSHQPHLENFFDAIRKGTKLNCPPEIGYATAVAVLTINKAIEQERKIEFKAKDFKV